MVQHQVAGVDIQQTNAVSFGMEWLQRLLKLLFVLHKAWWVLVQLTSLYCGLVGEVVVLLQLTL